MGSGLSRRIAVDLTQNLYALDSTTIDLCPALFPWAKSRKHKAAVKMHTLLDLHGNIPSSIRITGVQSLHPQMTQAPCRNGAGEPINALVTFSTSDGTSEIGRNGRKLLVVLAAALLLAPSAWFAWRWREMPHLGSYHDDAVYWISAQSLAQGHGYRLAHLPENPAQTKYPPLYPALLAAVWWMAGTMPRSHSAMALQWAFVPLYLGLAWLWFRRCRFPALPAYGLTLLLALGPVTNVFAVSPMSELPCSVLLLAAMLLLESERELPLRRGFLAGVVAAAAFLVRTNAIVLAVSVPFLLLRRRSYRAAAAFLAPLLAAIASWQIWSRAHAFPAKDDILAYYTAYIGFYIKTFSWPDLPQRAWVNTAAAIEALARLVLFNNGDELWIRPLAWLITVTAVAGVVGLYRGGLRHYAGFALLFTVVLVLWQYPPDTRFVFPLLPLFVAGLATKLREVVALGVRTWRTSSGANRAASVFVLLLIFALAGGSVYSLARGTFVMLPEYFADRQEQYDRMMPAYRWISANTPPRARFAAYDDTLLYLHFGRQGYTVPILPSLVYGLDPDAVRSYITRLPALWRKKGVTHVLVTAYDFRRDLHQPALEALLALTRDASRLRPIYTDPIAQVYEFSAPSSSDK
jgi:hypothetical protein